MNMDFLRLIIVLDIFFEVLPLLVVETVAVGPGVAPVGHALECFAVHASVIIISICE